MGLKSSLDDECISMYGCRGVISEYDSNLHDIMLYSVQSTGQ